ncbi:BsuPI-related putative proteinase inhibitor [Psychrobacillus sp. NPDC058041]|uniref:BsuPI-related putative proteinase inhibitor n=1 Tax=Psychrobacillus sp. NPDC058041 TaxID=3346310 RepID=UPI0036D989CD
MRKAKRVAWILLLCTPLIVLASCGTTNVGTTTGSEGKNESITTRLDLTADGEGSFIIKNESKKETILTSSSGQQIEFQLLNEAKEIMYTYSANKMFMQGIVEKSLQPGEEWIIPLNLQTELAGVPAGTYKLVVWSTANGLNDLKIETTYKWAGATTEAPKKLVVENQEVIYIGQQDLHSIEVENLEGTTEAIRLSEVAIPFFEGLEKGKHIIVEYVVENEQKVIQSARIVE